MCLGPPKSAQPPTVLTPEWLSCGPQKPKYGLKLITESQSTGVTHQTIENGGIVSIMFSGVAETFILFIFLFIPGCRVTR